MKFFKIKKITFGLAFLVAITGCDNSNQTDSTTDSEGNEDIITLTFASASPTESPFNQQAILPYMERVTELTDGQVDFDYYPAEQLGEVGDLLNLTESGVADIAYFVPNYNPSQMPLSTAITGMPGLFETNYEGTMAYFDISQQSPMLETDFLSNGVRPIFTMITPTQDIFTGNQEIKVPDDLQGSQIRTAGGVISEALEFAGASPISINTGEMYDALDRGTIDAAHMYASTLNSFGMEEIIAYGTRDLNFSGTPLGFVINEDVWSDLSKDIQDALLQAGEDIAESSSIAQQDDNNEVLDEWENSTDITIHELSEEERNEWDEFFQEFNDYWIEEQDSEEFHETLEQFENAVEDYED